MILMPVAEPYGLDPGILSQLNKPFPIRGRIDQNTRTFHIEGMAEGVSTPVFARNKPYGPKMPLFRSHLTLFQCLIHLAHQFWTWLQGLIPQTDVLFGFCGSNDPVFAEEQVYRSTLRWSMGSTPYFPKEKAVF